MPKEFAAASREHMDLKADVYPDTYWQATFRVLVTDRDFFNADKVARALADNGDPGALRISRYVPEPAVAGKPLEEAAAAWNLTPLQAYMRTVKDTSAEVDSGASMEEVVGTSTSQHDGVIDEADDSINASD